MPKGTELFLGLDISLSSTGLAVIEVKNDKPKLVETTHIATSSSESLAQRYEVIEMTTALFIRKYHLKQPFSLVCREKFASPNPNTSQKIFGAWSAVDRALAKYGYEVGWEIAQTSVKKTLTGRGGKEVTKEQIQKAVRSLLNLPSLYKFGSSDESDAAAVVLAYLKKEGVI